MTVEDGLREGDESGGAQPRYRLTVTPQGEEPHFVSCSLWGQPTNGLSAMTSNEADAIAEMIAKASGKRGAVLTWFPPKASAFAPVLPNTLTVAIDDGSEEGSRRCALYAGRDDLPGALRTVWNAFGTLRILPSDDDSVEAITELVESDADDSDEVRVGLDWQNKWYFQQKSGCLAVLGGIAGTIVFFLRLKLSPSFRRELMDPFRQVCEMRMAREQGAVFSKVGDGDHVGIQGLSSNRHLAEEVGSIFLLRDLPIEIRERAREDHWTRDRESR
ncbi:MAG: hypothetical protein AAGE94_00790 [Acidobacteriota bacterium]